MSYFEDQEHFINYLNKYLRESVTIVDTSLLLSQQFYLVHIYNRGLADKYGWAVKKDPRMLEEPNVLEWLKTANGFGFVMPRKIEHVLTDEFIRLLDDLINVCGVYSFWSEAEQPIYIGMSFNLGSRIIQSFEYKLEVYNKPIYLRFITTATTSDAVLLEAYFIAKLKPALNSTSKYKDELTLDLVKVPEFSPPVRCNQDIPKLV